MIDPLFAFAEAAIAALWSIIWDLVACAVFSALVLLIAVFYRGGMLGLTILSACLLFIALVSGALH